MKRLLFLLFLSPLFAQSQSTQYLRADSVMFMKSGGNSEFILLNGTRNVTGGVLTNVGNGRTAFLLPSGGGGGLSGGNLGSAYRWYVPGSAGIKTAFPRYGILLDSSTSNQIGVTADTAVLFPAVRATISLPYRSILGTIYNNDNFVTSLATNGLTSFGGGGTNTVSGGSITSSGGNNTYAYGYYIDTISRIEKWKIAIKFRVTGSVVANGLAIGTYSRNATLATHEMVSFRPYDSLLRIEKGMFLTSYATSYSKLNYTLNDDLVLIFERDYNIYRATIRNQTTNGAPITVTYRHNATYGVDAITSNTSSFGIWNVGGTFRVDSINVASDETVRPRIYIFGDSKTDGAWAGTYERSWVNLLRNYTGLDIVNSAGSGDKASDWLNHVAEALRVNADFILMTDPSNSRRNAVSQATYEAQYQNIVSYFTSIGKRVIHLQSFYETSQDNSAWNTFLPSTYSAGDIIPMYDVLQYSGALVADGVHPSELGHYRIASRMMQYISLFGVQSKRPINTQQWLYSPKDGYLQILGSNPDSSIAALSFGPLNIYNPMLKRYLNGLDLIRGNEGGQFADFRAHNGTFAGGFAAKGILAYSSAGAYIQYNSGQVYFDNLTTDASTFGITNIRGSQVNLNTNATIVASTYNNSGAGMFGVGTTTPSRTLHSNYTTNATNSIQYPFRITHATIGTATTGFGVGMEVESENASGTNRVVGSFTWPFTDATNASEDADYVLSLMQNGTLGEKARMTSTGLLGIGTASPLNTLDINGDLRVRTVTMATSADSALVKKDGIVKALPVAFGTYTPTYTGVSNVASTSAIMATYNRIGNVVTLTISCSITPTAAADALTQVRVSLPVASNFSATTDAHGQGGVSQAALAYVPRGLSASADTVNDELLLSFNADQIIPCYATITLQYQVK